MISTYTWDCPKCSKLEKPCKNTVAEIFVPCCDWRETQTTVYSCKKCGWINKRIYNFKTKITTDYEISFDKKGNMILQQVQEY
jgi:uncharacterized Zn finger protein